MLLLLSDGVVLVVIVLLLLSDGVVLVVIVLLCGDNMCLCVCVVALRCVVTEERPWCAVSVRRDTPDTPVRGKQLTS